MSMRKVLSVGLLLASVGGLAVSAVHIVPYIREEVQSATLYAELAALYAAGDDSCANDMTVTTGIAALSTETAAGNGVKKGNQADGEARKDGDSDLPEGVSNEAAPPVIHSGLLALHQKNPDCVAWISIEGTAIDYPVMYHPAQKNYYLHRNFNGKRTFAGALFIAENCDPDDSDNVIIYGHNMTSGSMFAALNKYKKQSFFEDHSRIVYETLHGLETYEVMFAFTTRVYTGHDFQYYAFSKANSAEEYDAYISACRERALYDTGVTARYGDKLLTLSTCEYSHKNGRMVVVAKKIT